MANGQARPAFYVAVLAVVVGLVGLAILALRRRKRRRHGHLRRRDELKQVAGERREPRQPGITTVKEYNFVPAPSCPRCKGISELQGDERPHRAVRDQRVGRLGADHLREQRLQAGQGVEDAGRQGLQGRARADRRPGRDARRLRRRQRPHRLGDGRHGAAVPRGAAQGLARRCRASTSRSTGRTAATASSSAKRSRRWPTCAARRSCSRRTRRRTSSCSTR